MQRFIIEREIPAIGSAESEEFRAIARQSIEDVRGFAPDVQWVKSYVAADKTYCLYLATSEDILRQYLAKSSFPWEKINHVNVVIDPSSEGP
ncbi:MAG: DUF4242 domain-containing protein [Planctomycetota bacterium]|jgi:hypothetical protein